MVQTLSRLAAERLRTHSDVLLVAFGAAIAALGFGAGLLPLAAPQMGAGWIGWTLVVAGALEVAAAGVSGFEKVRFGRAAAGAATLLAGVLLILNPVLELIPIALAIVAWIVARGAILLVGSYKCRHPISLVPIGAALAFGALADILLAAMLASALPAAVFISTVFGPTPELVQSFGWIFAATFFVTGVSLALEPHLRNRALHHVSLA